jgi:hypothetical protein
VTLPEGYRLAREPDVLRLVSGDGLLVAAFSARGATQGAVEEAAWDMRTRRRGRAGNGSFGSSESAASAHSGE